MVCLCHRCTKQQKTCAFKNKGQKRTTSKREEEKNAKRRSVGSFPDFQIFATLFSPLLSLRPSSLWSFSLSRLAFRRTPHLPSDRLPRARCSSWVSLERERKREGIKVVLRSSTLIIIIIKYDQTRHQRRIQVAEIRSEEHQIGLVPEKLLPMHETGLSSQEASGKRTREVRKPAQSRETELVIAQSAEKQVTAAERYHRHTQQGGKEEE